MAQTIIMKKIDLPEVRLLKWILVLLLSLAFTGAGIFLAFKPGMPETKNALAVALFFGFCSGIALWQLISEARFKRRIKTQQDVSIQGGIRIYNRIPSQFVVGGLVTAIGLAMFILADFSLGFRLTSLAMGILGVAWLILMAMGVGRRYLAFSAAGLEMGTSALRLWVQWDNVQSIALRQIQSMLCIGISVISTDRLLAAVRAKGPNPDHQARRQVKAMAWNVNLYGCHLVLYPAQHGLDPAYLFQALERYLNDPKSREELRAPEQIGQD
jgi:hypothetical protein